MGALSAWRAAIAGYLANIPRVDKGEWTVHPAPVDAVSPPCYMLASPVDRDWLEPTTACAYNAHLDVLVIAGRIDPDPNYALLEEMLEGALVALPYRVGAFAAYPFEAGGLRYLATRIPLVCPITLKSVQPV